MLVEIGLGERPWGPPETMAERKRILQRLGPTPLRLDLWIRTTDRYAEAHQVVGGVEWLASTEGVEVYTAPCERSPVARRSPAEVRCQNVSAWMEHAMLALDEAMRIARTADPGTTDPPPVIEACTAASERAVNALLVAHGVAANRQSGAAAMISQLLAVDPIAAADLYALIGSAHTPLGALQVSRAIVRLLLRDARLASCLQPLRERLSRPILIV